LNSMKSLYLFSFKYIHSMKFLLVTAFSLFTILNIHGQIKFDVAFRVGNSLTSEEDYNRSFSYTSRSQIDDDRYTETQITSNVDYQTSYTRRGRMELEASVIFPLGKGLHLKTGLGLGYQEISFEDNVVESQTIIGSVDTLFGMFNTSVGNPNFKPCQYENSFSDVLVPNDNSKIWSLLVPLEFEYDVISKLAIRAGGYIETPIVTEHNTHYVGVDIIEELEDVRLCRYRLTTNNLTNGANFNDLVYGYTLGAAFRIGNHIGVEVMYRHGSSGTYNSNDSSFFSLNSVSSEFKNKSIMIGLNYKFGEHAGHEDATENLEDLH